MRTEGLVRAHVAHCVAWDGEGDDWGEESYYDPAVGRGGSEYEEGGSRYDRIHYERVGRMVTIVDARRARRRRVRLPLRQAGPRAVRIGTRGVEPKRRSARMFEWDGSARKSASRRESPDPSWPTRTPASCA